jgi:hypothetical protein
VEYGSRFAEYAVSSSIFGVEARRIRASSQALREHAKSQGTTVHMLQASHVHLHKKNKATLAPSDVLSTAEHGGSYSRFRDNNDPTVLQANFATAAS